MLSTLQLRSEELFLRWMLEILNLVLGSAVILLVSLTSHMPNFV